MFPKLIDRKELNEDFIKKEKKRKEGKMKKGEKENGGKTWVRVLKRGRLSEVCLHVYEYILLDEVNNRNTFSY